MSVGERDVLYVADLANLELTEQERAHMLRDLNSILDYINRLKELDTADVPPMAAVCDRIGVAGAMRPDQVAPSLGREAGLQNAPESDGAFFKVPRVIEK